MNHKPVQRSFSLMVFTLLAVVAVFLLIQTLSEDDQKQKAALDLNSSTDGLKIESNGLATVTDQTKQSASASIGTVENGDASAGRTNLDGGTGGVPDSVADSLSDTESDTFFPNALIRKIDECVRVGSVRSMNELRKSLELKLETSGTEKSGVIRETEFTNTHFVLPNGDERRIRVEGRSAKLFSVDSEGLPEFERDLRPDEVNREISKGVVRTTQTSYYLKAEKNESAIRIEEENGKILELHARVSGASLGCNTSDCECLTLR